MPRNTFAPGVCRYHVHSFIHGVCPLLAVIVIVAVCSAPVRAAFQGANLVVVTLTDAEGHSASAGLINPYDGSDTAPLQVQSQLDSPVMLKDGDTVLGVLNDLSFFLDGDPVASLMFDVTSGSMATTFSISTATIAFAALNNPSASAQAEVTLTDNAVTAPDGATISTVAMNTGVFSAIYNGSTNYAQLLAGFSVMGGSTNHSDSTSDPIAGAVDSILARFEFQLSPFDRAMGSGSFTVEAGRIIPEPSTAALLLLPLAGLIRRR